MTKSTNKNLWVGLPDDEFYQPQTWKRFVLTGPLSVVTLIAMVIGSRFIKPSLPEPPAHNAIEARLVMVLPPAQPAGLQGGPATATVKSKPIRPKPVVKRPPIETPPLISPNATSKVGAGPSVATSPAPSGNDETVGIPGGAGIGNGAGVGNDASGARAIYAPTPTIPDELREDVFQAVAIAHFKVSPDGTVEVTLEQPTRNPRLNQILLNTLRQWKFFPAMRDGIAINSEFDIRIPVSVQ